MRSARYVRLSRGAPAASTSFTSGTSSSVSSEREMPTVTVFAWCLIASIGRVSSSIAFVSAALRSSTTVLGVPTLPNSIWYVSSCCSPVA